MKKLKKIIHVIGSPEKGFQQVTQEAHFLIMACIVVTSKIVLLVARFDLFREYCEALTYQYMYSMKDLFNLNLTNVQIEKIVSYSQYQSLRSTFLNSIVMYFLE